MARYARVCFSVLLVGVVLIPVVAAAQPAAPGRDASAQRDSHQGIVVLQFDDGTSGHYTQAFPILEKYGLQGSFGVVTGVFGRPGRLTAEQVVEMHRAGQEIHDHTLDHNAAFWGNPQQRESWKQQIEQSLSILKTAGTSTAGARKSGAARSRLEGNGRLRNFRSTSGRTWTVSKLSSTSTRRAKSTSAA